MRHRQDHRKTTDHPWRSTRHLFLDGSFRSRHVDVEGACQDAHRRENTATERRRYQIGWCKALTTALVVPRSIRIERALRRTMHSMAMQLSLIFHLNRTIISSSDTIVIKTLDYPMG